MGKFLPFQERIPPSPNGREDNVTIVATGSKNAMQVTI